MALTVKRRYTHDGPLGIPTSSGTPAGVVNRDFWLDSATGKLAFRVAGATALVPLAAEIGGAGLTQEQIEDFVALLIVDNAHLDWTYVDATPALTAVIKAGSVANAELANMVQSTIKGRAAASGSGAPVDLTAAQVKTILALVAADISDFQTTARAAISATDTATLDLTYNSGTGALNGIVLDSPTIAGQTPAQLQTTIVNAISGGASAAYDTLIEIQNLMQADDTVQAGLTSGLAIRARFYAAAVTSGSPTATVTHGFALANIHDFQAKIFVSATGVEEEYETVGATTNTITVTDETGANIATGRRIFITAGV